MRLGDFLQTWEGLQARSRWSGFFCWGLMFAVLLLSLAVFRKDTIVVMQPVTLSQEAWLSKSAGSRSYKEAWGLFFAQMLGNATPANVEFVKERLVPFLSPKIYQQALDSLHLQAKQIKSDRLAFSFEPKLVEFEEATGKVFVTGCSLERAGRCDHRTDRTFEFKIEIGNHLPILTAISSYTGVAKTAAVLQEAAKHATN